MNIAAKPAKETGILYVRGMSSADIEWIKTDAAVKNMNLGEYFGAVTAELRKADSSKGRTKKAGRKVTKKRK